MKYEVYQVKPGEFYYFQEDFATLEDAIQMAVETSIASAGEGFIYVVADIDQESTSVVIDGVVFDRRGE